MDKFGELLLVVASRPLFLYPPIPLSKSPFDQALPLMRILLLQL